MPDRPNHSGKKCAQVGSAFLVISKVNGTNISSPLTTSHRLSNRTFTSPYMLCTVSWSSRKTCVQSGLLFTAISGSWIRILHKTSAKSNSVLQSFTKTFGHGMVEPASFCRTSTRRVPRISHLDISGSQRFSSSSLTIVWPLIFTRTWLDLILTSMSFGGERSNLVDSHFWFIKWSNMRAKWRLR